MFGIQKRAFTYFSYWKRAFYLVWDAAPGYTTGWAIALLFQGLIPVATVYITKHLIDSIVAAKDSGGDWSLVSNAVFYLVAMGVALLLTEFLKHAGAWIRTAQAESVGDFLSDKIHRKAAELDLAFYESPDYHDLLERAKGDSSSKPLALLESLGAAASNSITMAAFAGILIAYAWWLPVLLLLGTLPALWVVLHTDKVYHDWWKSRADERRWATYYDAMLTHSDAAAEMRLFGLSGHFRGLFQQIRARLRGEKVRYLKKQSFGKVFAGLFALAASIAAIGWMFVRVLYGLATLGDLGVFYQIFSRGQSLLGLLLGSVGKTVSNSLYLESLFSFLDLEPKVVPPAEPVAVPSRLSEGISIRGVSFFYPGSDTPALRNFDLFIPAGSVVALVGVNGAGKSTLIKLLNRFYDPSEGSLELDGIDLRRFDPAELRSAMSVLFQFPMHYHALADENIALGNVYAPCSEKDVLNASKQAGSHEFITSLPDRYKTLLGKWFVDGTELSGGEWQRLALARAYYRRAPVVILDEPTSFMDSWAEADWFERFRAMVEGKTAIVITHRFTVAMRADTIKVVDKGAIIESGTHGELLAKGGFYAKSWNRQMKTARERGSKDGAE